MHEIRKFGNGRLVGLSLWATTLVLVVGLFSQTASARRCQEECDAAYESCQSACSQGDCGAHPEECEAPCQQSCYSDYLDCSFGASWCRESYHCYTYIWLAPDWQFGEQWTTCFPD
jgi:hypothetical protein